MGDTRDAEIKVPFVENAELTNVFFRKHGTGQTIASHALPTARNFFFVLISTFPVHSLFPDSLHITSLHPTTTCDPAE